MFINKAGKHPVAIGISIIHTTKEFDDYHYLSSQLKSHCKGFEALQAYDSDGEINIVNAFLCELPEAVHLRCKIHLADNIDRKLTAFFFSKTARQTVLNYIFGKRIGDVREKGLANADSSDDFDSMLQKMKKQWCEIEATQHLGKAEFFPWFEKHLSEVMKENVISLSDESLGLVHCLNSTRKISRNVATALSKPMQVTRWDGQISACPYRKRQSSKKER